MEFSENSQKISEISEKIIFGYCRRNLRQILWKFFQIFEKITKNLELFFKREFFSESPISIWFLIFSIIIDFMRVENGQK